MKKLFLIISLLAIATWANAFDLQVFWDDPNNPAGSLTGYKLKIGEATKTYTTVITIANPAARTYTITAFDTTLTIAPIDAGAYEAIDLQFPYTGQALEAYSSCQLAWTN